MIRHIVAIDMRRGMVKNRAMPPWKLSKDEAYFTDQTLRYGGNVLMGRRTFSEALKNRPLQGRTNYVASRNTAPMPGVIVVNDLAAFVSTWPSDKDLWLIGGAEIFAQTIDITDELYVTEIAADFACDRFYPSYKTAFELVRDSEAQVEHNITYYFRVYRPKI